MLSADKYETGSSGFVWQNHLPSDLFNQIRFHVYTTHHMVIGKTWAGSEFINHYNRVYYVNSGEAVLKAKGKTIQMRPGHVYLIPPYQLSSHYALSELDFYWCHFQAAVHDDLDFFTLYPDIIELNGNGDSQVPLSFKLLADNNEQTGLAAQAFRNSTLMQLLLPFLDKIDSSSSAKQSIKHKALMPAINLIQQNLHNPPQIKALAELCNFSLEHFSRSFKQAFNISPKRYILATQLAKAKKMLLLEDLLIERIAEQCGFGDIYHFSKTFKQEVGLSPTEYRRQKQSENLK
ncbi:AraC family transcriptional regulator [Catenovulum agarivorans DS-2]|uniref:AraC family transcriptional regulator n=2 Tax=Catenovulum agarivorans TaxID=1172192 RepID=W7QJ66_9ALTE|nr:AraC family transcriptional regulator [Catenovulum agarivorans DS-2]